MLTHWPRRTKGIPFLPFIFTWTLLLDGCLLSVVGAKEFFVTANDKEILDFLLHKSNYDKRVKPETKNGGAVVVDLSLVLLSLSSPDESSLKYEVDFLLHARWSDPRLSHDDKLRHPYLCAMSHFKDIWVPELFFVKHGDFKDPLNPENVMLRVYRNGTVDYTRRRYLNLNCEGNLDVFPFDDPVCQFFIESSTYETQDMLLVWRNDSLSNKGQHLLHPKSLKELNAYLIHNETKECEISTEYSWRGNFSCLHITLIFSRDDSFYFSTVFIPSIILVTSSFITFWLEWNAVPARVMIGVTTMLNFFTTSNSFRSTLPVVSNLAAMNLWDSVCMFFIYVSLLEFVVVNYVGRKRPKHNIAYMPGENAVIQVLSENRHAERKRSPTEENDACRSDGAPDLSPANKNSHDLPSCANCGNSQCSHSNAPIACADEHRKKDPTHPIRMAKSIDVVSRVVFPLGYSIFLLYFFGTYMGFTAQPHQ